MKTLLLGILLTSTVVKADEGLRTVRTQLCEFWKYDFNTSSYTCNYVGRYVNLVEENRKDETISSLENKIADLESRIQKLETDTK